MQIEAKRRELEAAERRGEGKGTLLPQRATDKHRYGKDAQSANGCELGGECCQVIDFSGIRENCEDWQGNQAVRPIFSPFKFVKPMVFCNFLRLGLFNPNLNGV